MISKQGFSGFFLSRKFIFFIRVFIYFHGCIFCLNFESLPQFFDENFPEKIENVPFFMIFIPFSPVFFPFMAFLSLCFLFFFPFSKLFYFFIALIGLF